MDGLEERGESQTEPDQALLLPNRNNTEEHTLPIIVSTAKKSNEKDNEENMQAVSNTQETMESNNVINQVSMEADIQNRELSNKQFEKREEKQTLKSQASNSHDTKKHVKRIARRDAEIEFEQVSLFINTFQDCKIRALRERIYKKNEYHLATEYLRNLVLLTADAKNLVNARIDEALTAGLNNADRSFYEKKTTRTMIKEIINKRGRFMFIKVERNRVNLNNNEDLVNRTPDRRARAKAKWPKLRAKNQDALLARFFEEWEIEVCCNSSKSIHKILQGLNDEGNPTREQEEAAFKLWAQKKVMQLIAEDQPLPKIEGIALNQNYCTIRINKSKPTVNSNVHNEENVLPTKPISDPVPGPSVPIKCAWDDICIAKQMFKEEYHRDLKWRRHLDQFQKKQLRKKITTRTESKNELSKEHQVDKIIKLRSQSVNKEVSKQPESVHIKVPIQSESFKKEVATQSESVKKEVSTQSELVTKEIATQSDSVEIEVVTKPESVNKEGATQSESVTTEEQFPSTSKKCKDHEIIRNNLDGLLARMESWKIIDPTMVDQGKPPWWTRKIEVLLYNRNQARRKYLKFARRQNYSAEDVNRSKFAYNHGCRKLKRALADAKDMAHYYEEFVNYLANEAIIKVELMLR